MELFDFESAYEYEKSMLRFYTEDTFFKNNKSGTFRIVCNPRGVFYHNTIQRMIGVWDCGEILCQCVFIKHKAYDAVSVSFFEAKQNTSDAVDLMMNAAADFAFINNAKQLEISLDGHCDYGVGFAVCEQAAKPPLFGESYNPDYYHNFFSDGYTATCLTSYTDSFDSIEAKVKDYLPAMQRRGSDITITPADFHSFPDTMKRYTDLNNTIFIDHRYCFHREYAEDMELFSGMKILLSPSNLLFARKNGRDIGFLLMYPDFNELVPLKKGAGVNTYLRHKLLREPMRTMKIVQIGVLSEFKTGETILLLFAEGSRQIKRHYPYIDRITSSWILDENKASRSMVSRLVPGVHKRYVAYEKKV